MTITPFTANILTLFPDMFPGVLGGSIHGAALAKELWRLNIVNIRDFADDKHKTVDDTPYGGGAGMVMRADILGKAIESLETPGKIYALSPRGMAFNQSKALDMSENGPITLICGRYEGLDQRVIDHFGVEELSIGDYVLSGGEVAAQVVLEAIVRLIPGVVGGDETLNEESFTDGLLEYPHYTKPQKWGGQAVPDVLLSGHHGEIAAWRKRKSKELTKERRPDLWQKYEEKNT